LVNGALDAFREARHSAHGGEPAAQPGAIDPGTQFGISPRRCKNEWNQSEGIYPRLYGKQPVEREVGRDHGEVARQYHQRKEEENTALGKYIKERQALAVIDGH